MSDRDASALLLTSSEVSKIVARLEFPDLPLTRRQLQLWARDLDQGGFGIGLGKIADTHNATRLFTIEDVALVRLIRRLQRNRVSPRVTWGLLVIQRAELDAALRERPFRVLWIGPTGHAHFLSQTDADKKSSLHCYPLAVLFRGIEQALADVRECTLQEVWDGRRWVPAMAMAAPSHITSD